MYLESLYTVVSFTFSLKGQLLKKRQEIFHHVDATVPYFFFKTRGTFDTIVTKTFFREAKGQKKQ